MVHLLDTCAYIGSSVVIAGKVPVMHRYSTMRRRALAISYAFIVEWEWEHTPVVGGVRCSSTSSPCAMGVMAINSYNNNWSHDSDSLLEMMSFPDPGC